MIDSSSGSWISCGSSSAPCVSAGTLSVLTTPLNPAPCPTGTFSSTQALPHISRIGVHQRREIDVLGVHLVDHDHAAQARLAGFVEHAPRVDFDAGLGIDDDRRRVDPVHGSDRLADEVGVTRRIDHLEVLAAMVEMDDLGLDRVLVVLLFRIEVADAGSVVHTRMSVDRAGLDQHVVDERRLATPAMSTEHKIANVLNVRFRHCWNPLFPLSQMLSCVIFRGAGEPSLFASHGPGR